MDSCKLQTKTQKKKKYISQEKKSYNSTSLNSPFNFDI